jgi:hypothetical protein
MQDQLPLSAATSTLATQAKNNQMIPITDLEPLLNLLANTGLSPSAAFTTIGYDTHALPHMRKAGKTRLVVKWALQGVLAHRADKLPKPDRTGIHLGQEDLETLFLVLTQSRKALPGRGEFISQIIGHIALELHRMGSGK